MGKTAIIQIPLLFDSLDLKKHFLLFDNLVFIRENFDMSMNPMGKLANLLPDEFAATIDFQLQNIHFLLDKGFLEIVPSKSLDQDTKASEDLVINLATSEYPGLFDDNGDLDPTGEATPELYDRCMNFIIRAAAMLYTAKQPAGEVIPVIDRLYGSSQTTKHMVYKFLLQSIPEPKDTVPWEQLIDFKQDENARNKYHRLIGWINQMGKKNFSDTEFEDEYNELLSEYTAAFKAHKIKYQLGAIEWISKVATETASLKFSDACQTIFSVFKREADLYAAEAAFPGKQIAYIHHVKQNFS